MLRKFGILSVGLLIVIGCSSLSSNERGISATTSNPPDKLVTTVKHTPSDLTLIFSAQRQAEVEPCGCSLSNLGGVVREFNLLSKWNSNIGSHSLYVTGGTTFVAGEEAKTANHIKVKEKSSPTLSNQQTSKALVVARALGKLGARIVAPSVDDLILGQDKLRELAKEGGFTLVSSDLVHTNGNKPVFDPSYTLVTPKGKVTVLSISQYGKGKKAPKGMRFMPPKEAISKALKGLNRTDESTEMVVLVSMLGQSEVSKLFKEFSQLRVNLDASGNSVLYHPAFDTARQFSVRPMDRGRQLVRLDFDFSKWGKEFYNEDESLASQARVFSLTAKKQDAMARGFKKDAARFERQMEAEQLKVPSDLSSAIKFGYEFEYVGSQYDSPQNELSSVITYYKNTLRDAALVE